MRRTTLMMMMAAAIPAAALPAVTMAQDMKIAHVAPPGDPRDLGAHSVADFLAASDSCDLTATVFPSGQLGGTTDLIEGMQIGSIEAVILPAAFMVGFQPKIGIFDFPFFWPTDTDSLTQVLESDAMRSVLDTTDEIGVTSIGVWHTGYKEWTGNKPLRTLADFEGLRSRVMPSPILVEQQELLGLNPVNMPFPETYGALQNGTIDAQENPVVTSYVMKFMEVQSHLTLTSHGNLDQLFMVSKSWFDGLDAGCQDAIRAASAEASVIVMDATESMEGEAMAAFAEMGITVTELTEEEFLALRDATLPGVEALYVQEVGAEGQAIIDALKAEMGRLE
ncbi:TRAP transporter substrate-binding protein [Ponticoccus sp. SC2-23]|uniref:TRAP transporter substrate-binding protein n=1 Tax=Alexandriicola marinus TaxID=2081710 RepID=UPI000FDC36CF|nr:TRAP transporter substrate-binding protein [Alexandriicola marinus]MBM1218591.1 TRAP transporter substrate-binding protein [Ponticoccus sp. SC6-9]MBM1224337.1 TRAP transporter substrate-binding protein [Ponticoccus sp. SC6-15]MBM1229884.1 TRAP transporter substrate-binding protein [Ponticoccus sp. SC6-38]MBM1233303.1 TRAP transporter substrate-binding protein [Ponticoccus sp. SC6-45]MBM1236747.1 TRAP transporter substrate-binding protein [Ponticoccus sp. SC6-49]MBM1242314.1 TRAP transporte